ncbi:unnamed protein product [Aspergillus oryzae RIB40]|uniref:DNA, SC009 n=1 Tax=Aspergillus oryzae (strain ATCC 42149 / RIB 40) TaxID=510516 RepID=Q2UV33_ASPOR|nr:unnamed protein product [Aspergillus oryzae RIB40]BAE54582.1 unnamed protein product [Aspergillus oryzae RIB40]
MGIHYHHDITALETLKLQPISRLAPFSALIISIVLVVLFVIRYYVLEGFLIKRLYGSIYTNLSEVNRRGFINHHIAGLTKILILIVAAYPFLEVVIGKSSFHTPYAHGSRVTMGDMLVVVAQMLIGIPLSGAFDIISEFFPHLAIILYRIFPNRHRFLKRLFLLSCITTALGTTCETIVIFFLFGSLWDRWQIAFKVVTPLLHIAFSAAQVHGSVVFWKMYKRQQKLEEEIPGFDIENGEITEMHVHADKTKPSSSGSTVAIV